jgi:hypothetical protein
MQIPVLLTLLGALLIFLVHSRRRNRRYLPLPPGPPAPIPWIRNLFQLPTKHQWLTFQEWSQKYGADVVTHMKSIFIYNAGDIFTVEALGSRYIVLGSREACIDLFQQKGPNISDRPDVPMLTELSVLALRIGIRITDVITYCAALARAGTGFLVLRNTEQSGDVNDGSFTNV